MTAPWDSRLAAALVRPLRSSRVHPNHVTTVGLVAGLVSAGLYARGGGAADLGAVLLVVTMIIDHADGELARMTGKTSPFGHAYDRVVDLVVKLVTFVGMGIGLAGGELGRWPIAFGASTGVALLVIFSARSALARRRAAAEAFHQPSFAGFEIEDILYLMAPLTWLGGLSAFLAAAGIGAPLFAAWCVYLLWRAVVADRAQGKPSPAPRGAPLPAAARPGLALGVAVLTGLVVYHGVGELASALARAGWGLVLVATFHLVPLAGDALGWRALVDPRERPGLGFFLRARWIGESVNGLLPVLQIGGNVVKARLLAVAGVPGARAGASVVVDVTTLMISQLMFTACGIALLLQRTGAAGVVRAVAVGALIMAALAAAFVAAQRGGLFGRGARAATRLAGSLGGKLTVDGDALDDEVRALHGRRGRLAGSAAWHLASWVVGAGEVWLALAFLGRPVDFGTALLLESLGQAIRAAAFAVPGAIGIQESGFLVLGAALGLEPETCLALSLAKRTRELLLGVPGLVAWQTELARGALQPPEAAMTAEPLRGRST
ncbi:MAG: lysylphosphatidylglycerol synthase domain-containing protein [Thermodesulfobacteriota bacterium]